MCGQPRAECAVPGTKEQDVNQSADDRGDPQRQVDEAGEKILAAEIEAGDGPCGGNAENGV